MTISNAPLLIGFHSNNGSSPKAQSPRERIKLPEIEKIIDKEWPGRDKYLIMEW